MCQSQDIEFFLTGCEDQLVEEIKSPRLLYKCVCKCYLTWQLKFQPLNLYSDHQEKSKQ